MHCLGLQQPGFTDLKTRLAITEKSRSPISQLSQTGPKTRARGVPY